MLLSLVIKEGAKIQSRIAATGLKTRCSFESGTALAWWSTALGSRVVGSITVSC